MEPLPGRPDSPTGFPCCESPRVHVPRPLPRRAGRPSHVGRSSRPRRPSSIREETRRSHSTFRGLLRLHSRCGPHTCWPAHGGPLSPELRRFGHPRRLPGSYQGVPTPPCAGLAPAALIHLSRRTLEFVVRRRLGAGRGPGNERPNAHYADRLGALGAHWQRSSVCGPPMTRGSVPHCSRPGTRQAFRSRSRPFQNSTWSRNSRRIVPIKRSTNGDNGTFGTVLIRRSPESEDSPSNGAPRTADHDRY